MLYLLSSLIKMDIDRRMKQATAGGKTFETGEEEVIGKLMKKARETLNKEIMNDKKYIEKKILSLDVLLYALC